MSDGVCVECGGALGSPRRGPAPRYCRPACRKRAYARRHRTPRPEAIDCRVCGARRPVAAFGPMPDLCERCAEHRAASRRLVAKSKRLLGPV